MRSWLVDIDGPVHVADFGGTGPTVILLHGLGGSHANWLAVGARLTRLGRVLCPDLPGFGRTRLAGRTSSLESNERLVDRLLDLMGRPPAILVGNSMGATIALRLAAARPLRIAALALMAPWVPLPPLATETAAAEMTSGTGGAIATEGAARTAGIPGAGIRRAGIPGARPSAGAPGAGPSRAGPSGAWPGTAGAGGPAGPIGATGPSGPTGAIGSVDTGVGGVAARPGGPADPALLTILESPSALRAMLRAYGARTPDATLRHIINIGCARPDRIPPEVLAAAMKVARERALLSRAEDGFAPAVSSLMEFTRSTETLSASIGSIKASTLIMQGTEDRVVPPSVIDRLRQSRPDWTYHMLDGVGHVPQFEVPIEVADTIIDWAHNGYLPQPTGHIRPARAE